MTPVSGADYAELRDAIRVARAHVLEAIVLVAADGRAEEDVVRALGGAHEALVACTPAEDVAQEVAREVAEVREALKDELAGWWGAR